MKLDRNGQFVTLDGRPLGIYATQNRGRWQYRSSDGMLYASGMTPKAFVKRFWYRDDFEGDVQ